MKRAFTLIELLIVVAIIAILAAIAVPNFLEAQTRAKVSRAVSDLRTLATGLETYRIDQGAWPKGNQFNTSIARIGVPGALPVLERLSTPIAYITNSVLPDPFASQFRSDIPNPLTGAITPVPLDEAARVREREYKYLAGIPSTDINALALWTNPSPDNRAIHYYALWSAGPDLIKLQVAGTGLLNPASPPEATVIHIYDPTNGTLSGGDIWRVGGIIPREGLGGSGFMRALSQRRQ